MGEEPGDPAGDEPKDVMVLGAIMRGARNFGKIQRETRIEPAELDSILGALERRGLIRVDEKKGWLGRKVELSATEEGRREVDEKVHELQQRWGQMAAAYKTKDKGRLKQYMDENRSFLPMMMFFGIVDIMMFSMMFSMMGAAMSDYVPAQDMPDGMDGGSDGGGMDGGGGLGDGGFDVGF